MSSRRRDIEGLRAVAVVVVVLYHCGVTGFSGGFVGVDVFFALSGYLITGLLLDERERTGTISLRGFYARRIRRLLPASAVVVVCTLAAGWLVLDPLSLRSLAGDAIGVATYTVNIRFAVQGNDYLLSDQGPSALLHQWSLAVEEQFYVLWPLLLLGATARRPSRRPGAAGGHTTTVTAVLGVVTVVSLAMSIRLTGSDPVWAFYALHTRAWEFAVGGLACVAGRALGARWSGGRAVTGWLGLALIAVAVVGYDDATPFPGWRAAVPVLGALLVLDAVVSAAGPQAALSHRALVWTGGRSYSIYLWHWPPLVLLAAAWERPLTVPEALATVAAASVVAVVVHEVVENPVRYSRWLAGRPARSFGMALGIAGVLVAGGLVAAASIDVTGDGVQAEAPRLGEERGRLVVTDVGTTRGPRPVPRNLTPTLAAAQDDKPAIYDDGCHGDYDLVTAQDCTFGEADTDRSVALLGDSHAAQWFPALEEIATTQGWRLESFTKSSCPMVAVSVWNSALERRYSECEDWREAVYDRLAADPPDVAVVGYMPRQTLADGTAFDDPNAAATWDAGLAETLARLDALGSRVVLIGAVPYPRVNVPLCLADHLDDAARCDTSRARATAFGFVDRQRDAAERAGATFVDTTDWFCGQKVCPVIVGDTLVFRDHSHVTTAYARFLAPLLRQSAGL